MAFARGSARVESVRGVIHVAAEFKEPGAALQLRFEYLTYVLWAHLARRPSVTWAS